jgi:3'-phosphoadenosine 5'-phosphosulfate (PAPS) 3'-phosphatase
VTDAELVVAATEAGADAVRARYGSSLARFGKSPICFATDADIESERAIMNVLRAARPTDGFIGEEPGAERRDATGEVDAVREACNESRVRKDDLQRAIDPRGPSTNAHQARLTSPSNTAISVGPWRTAT